jgi:chemotaxis protein MotA
MMVVDGVDPSQVRAILEIDIRHMPERPKERYRIFLGCRWLWPYNGHYRYSHGADSVLKELDDPGSWANRSLLPSWRPCGAILSANIIWLPLAGKLRANSEEKLPTALAVGRNPGAAIW